MTKNVIHRSLVGAVLSALVAFVGVSACSNGNDNTAAVLTPDNCATACNRYTTCFDSSFDEATCTDRCIKAVDDGTISVQTTQECVDCIGGNTCISAVYNCAGACSSIVVIQQ